MFLMVIWFLQISLQIKSQEQIENSLGALIGGRKMTRYFNTEGICKPNVHYMVRLDDRLARIQKQFVDWGKYFVINRGRQFGKTTTLKLLAEYLRKDYIVVSLDFQGIGTEEFVNAEKFAHAFAEEFIAAFTKGKTGSDKCEKGDWHEDHHAWQPDNRGGRRLMIFPLHIL